MRTRIVGILIVFSIILSACSSSAAPVETSAPIPQITADVPTSTAIPTELPTNVVKDIEGAKAATIQVEAQGSFVDPEFGQLLNTAGRGSGFIIDPSGIAVTNNHVVTGSALIKVWVGGSTEPLNARILGVSECWDLAVIDIEGEGFP